jgi:hypothetical protein
MNLKNLWPWEKSDGDVPAVTHLAGDEGMLESEQGGLAGFMAANGAPGHPVDDDGPQDQDAPAQDAPEPQLPEMSEEQRLAVDAYYARQSENLRQNMQQFGLDVTQDGRPVIADPNRFSQWAGPAPQRQQPQPAAPAPQAAAEPEEEALPESLLDLDGRALAALIDKRVARQTAAYQQEIQNLHAQLARQSANDALAGVQDALAAYPWVPPEVVEHPDFAESYRALAASVPPEQLEDPRMKATLALQIAPWLSPVQGRPASGLPASLPQGRDTQGRFVSHAESIAQGLVSRQSAGQVPPARSGMAAPPAASRDTQLAQNFIQGFAGLQSATRKYGAPTAEQLDALAETDPQNQYAAFLAARNSGRR